MLTLNPESNSGTELAIIRFNIIPIIIKQFQDTDNFLLFWIIIDVEQKMQSLLQLIQKIWAAKTMHYF